MSNLNLANKSRVFYYFEEICKIPHGSKNMTKIADFCVDFANKHNLKFVRDDANNVIIYKNGTKGYEESAPVILQGHLDMVCQKTPNSDINFETDGLKVFVDGDFIKAQDTTLGADNGIAVAMMLAILENTELSHPPIEAVFTTDEEIGMIGAGKLDMSKLTAKRMINLDMGKNDEAIISCAGGIDVKITLPIKRSVACGKKLSFVISGLKGGHSSGMIDKGRVNADVLAGRILAYLKKIGDFDIIEMCGGNKGNVIPSHCEFSIVVGNSEEFISKVEDYIDEIKKEVADREENLKVSIRLDEEGNFKVINKEAKDKIIYLLTALPNGVMEISTKIRNLVETSLNLGILKTDENEISLLYTLRSNKESALSYLQEKMFLMAEYSGCNVETSGHYPSWEYIEDTELQRLYVKCYKEKFGNAPKLHAVHAGLECGIFSSKIKGLDCIAIGPDMFDIHTVNERLSISATDEFFEFLKYFLSKCK